MTDNDKTLDIENDPTQDLTELPPTPPPPWERSPLVRGQPCQQDAKSRTT